MKAIDIVTATWYTPRSETENETPARFKLRGLTGLEFIEVQQKVRQNDEGGYVITAEAMHVALKYGLCDWEAFVDSHGADVPFARSQKDNIARLSSTLVIELSNEVMARTELPDEVKKK